MAGEDKKRYIILLNKSPKGPLSADEVRALLEQGILRRNDIAYQLPDSSDNKAPTEWKLLYQFSEFERRREGEPVVKKPAAAPLERRATEPTLDPKKTLSELPVDLLNIAPEDLLPRSTALGNLTERPTDDGTKEPLPEARPDFGEIQSSSRNQMVFGGFAMLLVLAGGWIFYSSWTRTQPAPQRQSASTAPTPPATNAGRSSVRPPGASTINAPVATPRTASDLPTAAPPDVDEAGEPDGGEVPPSEEDIAAENGDALNEDGTPMDPGMRPKKTPVRTPRGMDNRPSRRPNNRPPVAEESADDEGQSPESDAPPEDAVNDEPTED